MDVNAVKGRLEAMQDAWAQAPTVEGLPEGSYQAQVDAFDFFESKRGELFLKTVFRVSFGEYAGLTAETINSVENRDRMVFTKRFLADLGVDVDSLDFADLIPALEAVRGTPVEIAVKHREDGGKTYINVYVNRILGEPLPPEVAPDTNGLPTGVPPADGDDLPF